ncbi:DUF3889 domain-containing protein [Psychrobacillus psychrodurans]|uniref:YqzG/YhdC family protein n=1 Tax=Psychrobacillus psychrodurans TaxID=126157 RepID=A0A9X3R995_9BACI|nr:DUF3889 domain-containing protein [Psychrobacillus psychrodurans]MCZ8532696.1 YqzG/YhdC family protein [Psychrobacillus psychrodurans]
MQKIVIALGIITSTQLVPAHIQTISPTQQEIPAYAKWGQLAMKETQSKYPNASIIDYLHEGKETKESSTIEKFKLWLKDSGKEFGVSVRIEYITDTDELVNIQIQEN